MHSRTRTTYTYSEAFRQQGHEQVLMAVEPRGNHDVADEDF